MKDKTKILAVAVCLLTAVTAFAKAPYEHRMTVSAQLGYATMLRSTLETAPLDVRPWLGAAPAVGVGYQLKQGHFTFDLGCEMEYGVYTNRSRSAVTIGATTVPQGTTEMIQNLNINIPILFGGEWGKFYFKVGAGPSFCAYGTGSLTGAGAKAYKVSRVPQLRCHGEVGGQVGQSSDGMARYLLAAYADYGVLNERPLQRKGSYADGVPYHVSDESTADKLNGLHVGVKFTCVLDFSKKAEQ